MTNHFFILVKQINHVSQGSQCNPVSLTYAIRQMTVITFFVKGEDDVNRETNKPWQTMETIFGDVISPNSKLAKR